MSVCSTPRSRRSFVSKQPHINWVLGTTFFILLTFLDLEEILFEDVISVNKQLLLFVSLLFLSFGAVFAIMAVNDCWTELQMIRSYWRPCEGSTSFVMWQGFGWSFVSVALLGLLALMRSGDIVFFHGTATLIGVLGFAGLAFLTVSISCFEFSAVMEKNDKFETRVEKKQFLPAVSGDILLAGVMSVVSMTLFILADTLRPHELEHVNGYIVNLLAGFGQLGYILSAFSMHFMSGFSKNKFRSIMPFENTPSFIIFQGLSWTLLSIQILLVLLVLGSGLPSLPLPLLLSQIGGIGFISQLLLFLSFQFYDDQLYKPKPAPTKIITWGKLLEGESLVALLLSLCGTLCFVALDMQRWLQPSTALGGLFYLGIIAAIAVHVPPFITHIGGTRLYPEYNVWMPFVGPSKFVLLQSLGWVLYAISMLLTWIYLANYAFQARMVGISLVSLGSLTSNILILSSLSCFEAPKDTNNSANFVKTIEKGLSGEMILAWLICLCSFGIFLLVDFATFCLTFILSSISNEYLFKLVEKSIAVFPSFKNHLFLAGIMFQCLGPWLIQVVAGGRLFPNRYSSYHPLQGGTIHVALQALGWMISSVTLFFHLILYYNKLAFTVRGVIAISALFTLLSHFLLWISMFFYKENSGIGAIVKITFQNISGNSSDLEYLSSCSEDISKVIHFAKDSKLAPSIVAMLSDISCQVSQKQGQLINKVSNVSLRWRIEVLVSFILTIGNIYFWFLVDKFRFFHLDGLESFDSQSFFFPVLRQIADLHGVPNFANALAYFCFVNQWFILFIVHVVAGKRLYSQYKLYQPFLGGWNFCLFQGIGFFLSCTSLLAAWIILHYGVDKVTFDGILTSLGIIQATGNFCLMFSLKLFQEDMVIMSPKKGLKIVTKNYFSQLFAEINNTVHGDLILSIILSASGVGLFLLVDYLSREYPFVPSYPIVISASIIMFLAVTLAYSSSKKSKRVILDENDDDDEYLFAEDSQGFSWLQTVGLIVSALTFALSIFSIHYNLHRVQPLASLLSTYGITGISGVIAEVLLVIVAMSGKCVVTESSRRNNSVFSTAFVYEAFLDIRALLSVTFLYASHLIMYSILIIRVLYYQTYGAFAMYMYCNLRILFPRVLIFVLNAVYTILLAFAIWNNDIDFVISLIITLAYGATYFSNAPTTGSRRWKWFQECFLWNDCQRYFNYRVLGSANLDSKKTYIYGFHPHGILPFGLVWSFLTDAWKKKYPGVETDAFGATILMNIPIARDFGMWAGGRDVRKESIIHGLTNSRSVALVPGGQAEMRLSRCVMKTSNEISVLTKHQGFIRLALKYGIDLVPLFSFGETEIFENIYLPAIQQITLKYLGFLFPTWIYGRWFLNIPHNKALTLVVGDPITVSKIEEPTKDEINELHKKYLDSLRNCFEKHKAEAGYENCTLVFV